ncbi:MAG: serine/threonine-protein kinase, partial [Myxococcota bacterium]|nr:serine/threonine-protein kinase [Myxococcota bacterium]
YEAQLPGPRGFTKRVAIKRIRASVIDEDPRFVQSMVNEARIGGLLHHANIVDILEFGRLDEHWYIAMEFVDGPTLADVVVQCREHGVLLPRFAILDLALQICRGLQYAHELDGPNGRPLGLVHRDLKPSNIILDRAGTAKILDFGIAKAASNLFATTAANQVKGTPRYMAPEQVTGEAELSPRTDLFTLGAVLFEVITGRVLFDASTMPALVHKIMYVDLGRDLDLAENAFPGSGDLLTRMLAKEPDDRYPSAASVAADLRTLGHSYPPMADMSEVIGRLISEVKLPTGTTVRSLGELDDDYADESAATVRAEHLPERTPPPPPSPSSAGWESVLARVQRPRDAAGLRDPDPHRPGATGGGTPAHRISPARAPQSPLAVAGVAAVGGDGSRDLPRREAVAGPTAAGGGGDRDRDRDRGRDRGRDRDRDRGRDRDRDRDRDRGCHGDPGARHAAAGGRTGHLVGEHHALVADLRGRRTGQVGPLAAQAPRRRRRARGAAGLLGARQPGEGLPRPRRRHRYVPRLLGFCRRRALFPR